MPLNSKSPPVYAEALWFRLVLIGFAAIGPFSLNIFKPCLPWIKIDLQAPIEVVQLGLSLSIFAAAIAAAFSGPIADRFGRRHVILYGIYLFILGSLISAISPNAAIMVFGRILQAASSSVVLAIARAIVHDVFGEGKSAPIVARITFIVVLGVLLAPALGGLLIEWVSWRVVFVFSALIGVGLLIPTHTRLKETLCVTDEPIEKANQEWIGPLLKSPVFYGFAFQSAFRFAVFFAFTSAASYIMVDILNRPASEYGLWFIVMAVFAAAGLWTANKVNKSYRSGRVALCGSVIVFVACLISAWFLSQPHLTPLTLFLPPSIGAFGIGLALPGSNTGVMEAAPNLAGTASGLMAFLQMMMAALFAQLVVQDESRTPEVLAVILILGSSCSLFFSLLSMQHGKIHSRI
ncbi:hypothetical protein BVY03_04460 [bacterium K02(2017)]|nr:hypothetical protein BVY03_04460 [bacterium K02(2017)]